MSFNELLLDHFSPQAVVILSTLFFLCWGSWLNVVAYRLVLDKSVIWGRSHCPRCDMQLNWYHNIPVVSWIVLRGRCAFCANEVSVLYPFIELLTVTSLTLLTSHVSLNYFFAYFIFFSALIVTVRSDLETMLISRFVTLFLVPLGILMSVLDHLPLSALESLLGALFGYGILWLIAHLFYRITGKVGMGEGDFDLLAFIGAFTGPLGALTSMLLASISGSIYGILFIKNHPENKIPFGPFLAISAIIFVLYQEWITQLLLSI